MCFERGRRDLLNRRTSEPNKYFLWRVTLTQTHQHHFVNKMQRVLGKPALTNQRLSLVSTDQWEAGAGQEPWWRVINLQLLSSYHLTPQELWLTGLMPLNMTEQPWTTRQSIISCINEMKYAQALEWALEWDSILNLSLRNNHFYTNGLRDK